MTLVHINEENFENELMKSDIPVLVDFWAPWCGPCQMMGPIFEELSGDYDGKLKFAKLNTEDHPQLAGQFGIQGIPSLLFLKYWKKSGLAGLTQRIFLLLGQGRLFPKR